MVCPVTFFHNGLFFLCPVLFDLVDKKGEEEAEKSVDFLLLKRLFWNEPSVEFVWGHPSLEVVVRCSFVSQNPVLISTAVVSDGDEFGGG